MKGRIAVLERPRSGIEPLVQAMETLDDTEIGILQEYMSLLNAGFSLDEVSDMMGKESYQQAIGIVDIVDQELTRQTARAQPKQTKKQRKRQQACNLCCDIDTDESEC